MTITEFHYYNGVPFINNIKTIEFYKNKIIINKKTILNNDKKYRVYSHHPKTFNGSKFWYEPSFRKNKIIFSSFVQYDSGYELHETCSFDYIVLKD